MLLGEFVKELNLALACALCVSILGLTPLITSQLQKVQCITVLLPYLPTGIVSEIPCKYKHLLTF
jgi:hypothetical protein